MMESCSLEVGSKCDVAKWKVVSLGSCAKVVLYQFWLSLISFTLIYLAFSLQEDHSSMDKSDDLVKVLRELTVVQRNIANLQVELQGRKVMN
jgi:hypothetical protein